MDICTPKVSSTKQEFLSFLCNASIWSRSRVWDWWFYAKHKLSQLLNYTITSPTFHTIGPNNKQPKWHIDHVRRRRRGCCGWYLSRSWYACWGARNVRINNRAAATTGSPSRINYASYHLRRPALLEIFHLYGNWEQFVLSETNHFSSPRKYQRRVLPPPPNSADRLNSARYIKPLALPNTSIKTIVLENNKNQQTKSFVKHDK